MTNKGMFFKVKVKGHWSFAGRLPMDVLCFPFFNILFKHLRSNIQKKNRMNVFK